METNNKRHVRSGDGRRVAKKNTDGVVEANELAPGVPIVRSSTPKPLSFGMPPLTSAFPVKAPSAPPLPEELDDGEITQSTADAIPPMPAIPLTSRPRPALEESQEYIWLFEYGLEMDPVLLNSPERLNGVAMLYGPAFLKGYALIFGRSPTLDGSPGLLVVTIAPSHDPLAEVWGVLYRIPRRVFARANNEPSLLDSIHAAASPPGLFESIQVVVRERYRDRDIMVTTYAATEKLRQCLVRVSREAGSDDLVFLERVAATARKQRLPDGYVETYMPSVVAPAASIAPMLKLRNEKDTDPLPAWRRQSNMLPTLPITSTLPKSLVSVPASSAVNPWLTVLAAYLLLVLLAVLTCAILQAGGFGSSLLTKSFLPLGVPWLVLIYGLLGGCISCLVALGRIRTYNPPVFIILTWFARPYIGLLLAALLYLLLNSGLFSLPGNPEQRMNWFLLAAGLAGVSISSKRIEKAKIRTRPANPLQLQKVYSGKAKRSRGV